MADKKVKHSDLFEGDVFKPTQEGAERLLVTISELKDSFKDILNATKVLGNTPLNSSADIEKLNKALADNEQLRGEILKLQVAEKEARAAQKKLTDEQIAQSQIEKAQRKDRIDDIKAEKIASDQLVGTLQKLEAANTKLRLERKKLNLDTKEGQVRLKEINAELDVNNKRIKESSDQLKQQKLNVGNYQSALEGLPGPLGQAAQGVGNLGQQFKALLANPIVLLIAAITAALYGLFKAFTSTDSGANKFAAIMEQVSAVIDVARQRAALMANAVIDIFSGNWEDAANKFKSAVTGAGDQLERATAAAKEYVFALDELEDAENNYISTRAEAQNKIARLEFEATDKSKTVQQRRDALVKAMELSREEVEQEKKFAAEKLKIEAQYLAGKNNVSAQEILNFIRLNDAEQSRASKSLRIARDNNEAKFKELEELYAKYIEADTKYFEENKRNNSKITAFDEQIQKEREDALKKRNDLRDKAAKDRQQIEDELERARIRNIQNAQQREVETERQALKEKLRTIKGNTADEVALREELTRESTNKILAITKAYRDKEEEQAKQYAERQKQFRKEQQEVLMQAINDEFALRNQLVDQEKERQKKQREDAVKQSEDLLKIADEGLRVQAQRRKEATDREVSERKDAIDKQQELAEKGLDNQLAFEKQKLAQAELQKREEQERAIRQQKVIAYVNAFAEYAKQNPDTAPFKALAAVAIGEAIAGAFKDGVENLDGPGTETSDSILALLSKGESVATAKGTRENPGLVTAMNMGKVDEWIKENYPMPQMGAQTAIKVDTQISVQELRKVQREIKNLTEVIKDKPELNINWPSHDKRVETIVRNGMRQVITHQLKGPRI